MRVRQGTARTGTDRAEDGRAQRRRGCWGLDGVAIAGAIGGDHAVGCGAAVGRIGRALQYVILTGMEPAVRVEVVGCAPEAAPGHWRATWLIHNDGDAPIVVEDAWVPHGRFRGCDGHVSIDAEIAAGAAHRLTLSVASSEAAGTVVENAFLIVRLRDSEHAWRVFARMRVEFDSAAQARPVVELLSFQPVHESIQ